MNKGRWIMQGQIGRLRRNRNITSATGKGSGIYVIGDTATCDSDIASRETLRHAIAIYDINMDCDKGAMR